MTFLSVSFVFAGLLATLVPIVIHLLSKGKPKKILFPALRFAQAKLATNKRKLTLKRLVLLALRVGIFVVLGVALARPFFVPQLQQDPESGDDGANSGVATIGDEAVAAAIVVDSSARMGRVDNNCVLFERARETARSIVERLPQGSLIAILDGTYEGDAFQPDRFAAKTRLDKIEVEPFGRSVAQTTLEAFNLVDKSPLPREIYVITDETQAGWADRDVKRLKNQLQKARQTPSLYFVDVGADSFRNASIVDLTLSAETLATDASLRLDVEIERIGEGDAELAVEALIFDKGKLPKNLDDDSFLNDPKLVVRREAQSVSFRAGRSKNVVKFQTSGLPVGHCVGVVRIVGSDALKADDARWFAVDVQPERRLLVVAPVPIDSKSIYLTQALAPDELRKTGRAPFALDVVPFTDNGKKTPKVQTDATPPIDLQGATESELAQYAAIFLLDPPGLDQTCVKKLTSFVEAGGGLGVFLGRNASPIDAFQTPEATRLLGAKLTTQTRAPGWNREIRPVDYNSPLLAPFRPLEKSGVPWDAAPIGRFWNLTELAETTEIVATFSKSDKTDDSQNNPPALIENRLGRGLAATLATPISDGAQDSAWNALTSSDAPWVFVVFIDGIASRLASNSSSILNYVSGEIVTLRSPLKTFPAVATVLTPSGEEIASPTDVERRQIRFPGARRPGLYRVQTTPNRDGESLDLAFAVSVPSSEFDLSRRSDDEWKKLWEDVPYKTIDPRSTSETLDDARRGNRSEPYSYLVVVLAILFLAETGVANRFYRR